MGKIIAEVVDGDGVADAWITKQFTGSADRGHIESRFLQIEMYDGVHPKWTPHYKSLKMTEIKVDYMGKAVRFLCHETDKELVILAACIKKGQIDAGTEAKAVRRLRELLEGKLCVRNYPLPTR